MNICVYVCVEDEEKYKILGVVLSLCARRSFNVVKYYIVTLRVTSFFTKVMILMNVFQNLFSSKIFHFNLREKKNTRFHQNYIPSFVFFSYLLINLYKQLTCMLVVCVYVNFIMVLWKQIHVKLLRYLITFWTKSHKDQKTKDISNYYHQMFAKDTCVKNV